MFLFSIARVFANMVFVLIIKLAIPSSRVKHSTEHALISLNESIRKALDSGQFACDVFIDLQKAFDTCVS